MAELERLREENALLKAEIERLRGLPQSNGVHDSPGAAEAAADAAARDSGEACPMQRPAWDGANHGLSKEQIARYSRQVILHSFGVHGERRGLGSCRIGGWRVAIACLRRAPPQGTVSSCTAVSLLL